LLENTLIKGIKMEPNRRAAKVQHQTQFFIQQLKRGNYRTAINFFLQNQATGLFPKGQKVISWLIETIGKNATLKFIICFATQPCFNCSKGLLKCDVCNGKGYYGDEMICESCLGLHMKPCNFCFGAGWCTIDFVPPGLRFAIFIERIKITEKKIKDLLVKKLPKVSNRNVSKTLKEYVRYFFELNKQISVLETTTGITKQLVKASTTEKHKKQLSEITRKCVRTALGLKRRLDQIARQIATLSKMEAEHHKPESKLYRFMTTRATSLRSQFLSSPPWADTYLEHALLNKAVAKPSPRKTKK
jgi:predicted transcriptional regulator